MGKLVVGRATIFEDHEDSRRVWKWCSSGFPIPRHRRENASLFTFYSLVSAHCDAACNNSEFIALHPRMYVNIPIYMYIYIFVHIIVSRASSFTIIADSRMKLPFPNRVSLRRYVLIPVHCEWESECQSSSSISPWNDSFGVWTPFSANLKSYGLQFCERRIERETKLLDRGSIFQLSTVAWRSEFFK